MKQYETLKAKLLAQVINHFLLVHATHILHSVVKLCQQLPAQYNHTSCLY